jgi:hypothetical protein
MQVKTKCSPAKNVEEGDVARNFIIFVVVTGSDYLMHLSNGAGTSGRSVWDVGLNRFETDIVGLNLAYVMDV